MYTYFLLAAFDNILFYLDFFFYLYVNKCVISVELMLFFSIAAYYIIEVIL